MIVQALRLNLFHMMPPPACFNMHSSQFMEWDACVWP